MFKKKKKLKLIYFLLDIIHTFLSKAASTFQDGETANSTKIKLHYSCHCGLSPLCCGMEVTLKKKSYFQLFSHTKFVHEKFNKTYFIRKFRSKFSDVSTVQDKPLLRAVILLPLISFIQHHNMIFFFFLRRVGVDFYKVCKYQLRFPYLPHKKKHCNKHFNSKWPICFCILLVNFLANSTEGQANIGNVWKIRQLLQVICSYTALTGIKNGMRFMRRVY